VSTVDPATLVNHSRVVMDPVCLITTNVLRAILVMLEDQDTLHLAHHAVQGHIPELGPHHVLRVVQGNTVQPLLVLALTALLASSVALLLVIALHVLQGSSAMLAPALAPPAWSVKRDNTILDAGMLV
jgi:hypothetical protein